MSDQIDQTYLVPYNTAAMLDIFDDMGGFQVNREKAVIGYGPVDAITILEDTLGGCVVKLKPVIGDAREMATLLSDQNEIDALMAYEEAATEAEDAVMRMGGVPAHKANTRWIAITGEDRRTWAHHVSQVNTDRMKGVANENRMKWAGAA